MALMLSCESVGKSFGVRPLFTGVTLGVFDGERLGVIGPNGAGKSTLIRILAGMETADEGEVSVRRGLRISYLPQEDDFPGDPTVENLLWETLRDCPGDETNHHMRVSMMLGRVGFPDRNQHASELSGGWRKRLAIARALITDPELLMLDEPTNHLDVEGILWLEKLLLSASFSFLLISHDRYLLENVTTRIIEIDRAYPEGAFSIAGTYSNFLQKREEYLSGQESKRQALQSMVRQEIAWLQRGARARTTKAKGRIEDAGQLISELADSTERATLRRYAGVDFTATGRRTKKLLEMKNVGIAFGDNVLLQGMSHIFYGNTKTGLLGVNGSGKTTMLRLITGELEPDSGTIKRAEGLKIVYFRQDRGTLNLEESLRNALSPTGDTVHFRDQQIHVTAWAKRFLFREEQLPLPVGELSGGEQARILIARLMLDSADVLILDEPTNDLDIPSLEVLESALADFPGTLVLVTHDRYMLDRLCSELLYLDGEGTVTPYADYPQWESAQRTGKATQRAAIAKEAGTKSTTKKLNWKEARELEGMEAAILDAENEVCRIETELASPELFTAYDRLTKLSTELQEAQEQVKKLYLRWELLEAKNAQ